MQTRSLYCRIFSTAALLGVAGLLAAGSAQAELIVSDLDGTAPATNVFLAPALGPGFTNTKIEWDNSGTSNGQYKGRGQSFTTPGSGGDPAWLLNAITVQMHASDDGLYPSPLKLEIFNWGASTSNVNDIGSDPLPIFVPPSLREPGQWNTHAEPQGGA